MKSVVSLLAAAAAGLAVPAFAQASKPTPLEEPKQAKEAERICRMVALNPDSRRKEKLCLTATEWRKLNNPR